MGKCNCRWWGKVIVVGQIALTDVYTGSKPPDFPTAAEAKIKMHRWVGVESRFYLHVALHDFEAWLLPYWEKIKKLTGRQSQISRHQS